MNSLQKIKLTAPLAAMAVAFAFFSSGCSHSTSPISKQQIIPLDIDWQAPSFANSNNPYDYLGLRHNEGLQYVGARLSMTSNDTLYPSTDTLAIFYLDSLNGFVNSGIDDSLSSHLRFARYVLTHEDSLESSMPSADQSDYQRLQTYFNFADPSATIDSIRAYENWASTSLSGEEQERALVTAAVARYSAAFWSTTADSSLFPNWVHHNPPASARAIVYNRSHKNGHFTPQFQFWAEVGTDAVGALCGLPGGAGGACLGAICASSGYVIGSFWP